jgi:hypothetical protein
MNSINEEINLLHKTYCVATGIGDMPMVPMFERWYFEAMNAGVTCEDVRSVIADRQRRIRDGVRHKESLYLRNLIGSEEAIGSVIEEAAHIRALRRIKPVDTGKLEVLRATGRCSELSRTGTDQNRTDAVPIGKVIEEMRKAAG